MDPHATIHELTAAFAEGSASPLAVTEAYLVLTGTTGGGPGGTVAVVPGYLVDEAGTYNSLPTQGLNAAITANGSATAIGPVGPGAGERPGSADPSGARAG